MRTTGGSRPSSSRTPSCTTGSTTWTCSRSARPTGSRRCRGCGAGRRRQRQRPTGGAVTDAVTAALGQTVALGVALEDPDGDALRGVRFTVVETPAGSSWAGRVVRGPVGFDPDTAGRYVFDLQVSDAGFQRSEVVSFAVDVVTGDPSEPPENEAGSGCGCGGGGPVSGGVWLAALGVAVRRSARRTRG